VLSMSTNVTGVARVYMFVTFVVFQLRVPSVGRGVRVRA